MLPVQSTTHIMVSTLRSTMLQRQNQDRCCRWCHLNDKDAEAFDGYCNSNMIKQLHASKGNHYIDYSIHASILRPDQVKDILYLKELGVSSLKIYMNLGADLNRIHMDLEPGTYGISEKQVDMTDELMSSIVKELQGCIPQYWCTQKIL